MERRWFVLALACCAVVSMVLSASTNAIGQGETKPPKRSVDAFCECSYDCDELLKQFKACVNAPASEGLGDLCDELAKKEMKCRRNCAKQYLPKQPRDKCVEACHCSNSADSCVSKNCGKPKRKK